MANDRSPYVRSFSALGTADVPLVGTVSLLLAVAASLMHSVRQ